MASLSCAFKAWSSSEAATLFAVKRHSEYTAAGVIIGKAGSTIKQLSEDSGAFIQTARDHEVAPGSQERDVYIVGSEDQITVAKQLIGQLVSGAQDVSRGRGAGGPTPPPVPLSRAFQRIFNGFSWIFNGFSMEVQWISMEFYWNLLV